VKKKNRGQRTAPQGHRIHRKAPWLLGAALCATNIGMAHAQQADNAQQPQVEDTVVVKAKALTAVQKAKKDLDQVPGTTSVVNNADVERGRDANAEDVLAYQPGVFVAATSGNGANKISIRGSGLNAFYQGYSLGIKYLYDGLPLTGPGGTQEDLLNAASVEYTEILNGDNAFAYGALSLGGAINFVTKTGRSSPGNYVDLEAGSYGYRKYVLSTGGVSKDGNTDYYVSVGRNQREGFQVNSPNEGEDFIVNLGHKFNDRLETRFIIRHRWEDLMNGSTLTLGQIRQDPEQSRLLSGRRKPDTTLLISKTTYTIDDRSKLEFGLAYNDYPLDNGWKSSTTPQYWESTDGSVSLRYLRTGDTLFGKLSDTTVSLTDTTLLHGNVTGYNIIDGQKTFRQFDQYSGSHDTVLAAGNDLHLNDRYTLSSGLSVIDVDRNVRVERSVNANTSQYPSSVQYNDYYLAPRLGLLYQASPGLQFFGNVSRSIDPPVTWQIASTSSPYARPLTPQKATTAEAGLRIRTDANEASLTLYRSWVRDELLTVVTQQATATSDAVTANSNASPTIHQGIEAALSSRLWRDHEGDRLTLRQAYTFNDFFYRDDAQFGQNQLPSLPRQVYQSELLYQQAGGFYAGLNVRATSGYYVDYANTLKAPSVAIWGAKFGYETPDRRWKLFLDLRNLADKHYAVAANTAYDLHGVDSANFYPGDGFSIYTGVAYRF